MLFASFAFLFSALFALQPAAPSSPTLDYGFFKANVQPIFLARRPGSARCYACHHEGANGYLQPLTAGAVTWDEEQSRKNFESVRRYVIAGDPARSRLLVHPLAEDAGGDDFHGGGRQFASKNTAEWQTIAAWIRGEKATTSAVAAMAVKPRIIQTNSAGETVSLIDPSTNKVVGEIRDIEVNHGAAAAPDGSRLYVTNEADSTLEVVDVATLRVVTHIPLSGHPNNLSISKDGRRVYIAIAQAPGRVDVVDTAAMAKVKSIPIDGAGHNTFVTPDGKFVVAGSVAGNSLTVIDQATEEPVWSMKFDKGVRPIAFEKHPDGSTARIFVQLSDVHGFAVIDFATHKELTRVTLPDIPGAAKSLNVQGSPSHGIGITPDGKTRWVTSKWYHFVAAYSLPDLKLLGVVPVGHHPDWLTFSPDGKSVYVACAGSNSVSVVDVRTMKEVSKIAVGQVPKRNITAMLQ